MQIMLFLIVMTASSAMLHDLRTGRIPNVLFWTAAVTGIFYRLINLGWGGILSSVAGMALPAFLLMPLFRFRMMGAGDIKLLMGLGAIVGFPGILRLMLLSFVSGGIFAFLQMFFVTGFRERFSYLILYIGQMTSSGKPIPYRKPGRRPENIPFAVPVFMAAIIITLSGHV